MTTDLLRSIVTATIPAALDLLPPRMDSPEARAMLLATGLQESKFTERQQLLGGDIPLEGRGAARGFWQFEKGGAVRGVLNHGATSPIIVPICRLFRIVPEPTSCHVAIEYHDVLACIFARLLLFTDARRLPGPREPQAGLEIYLNCWRPGKPKEEDWPGNFRTAWTLIEATT